MSTPLAADGTDAASPCSIGRLLVQAVADLRESTNARLDSELLLSFVAGVNRGALFAYSERVLDAALVERFFAAVQRCARGEPLAYITGEREFYSLALCITPDVLVPRGDTESLVDAVLDHLQDAPRSSVLDVGTGSGAIALALKQQRPDLPVTAIDCDSAALRVAAGNAARLGLDVRFVESNWFAALRGERFAVIVSNPPYVRGDDPHFDGPLRYEPRLALDGGSDGLTAYRAIFAAAPEHLEPGGVLLLEHGYDQRAPLLELAAEHGFAPIALRDDLAGVPRVAVFKAARS
jgi:release factor glutamine methyltransferase